jgi:hypothetical protein
MPHPDRAETAGERDGHIVGYDAPEQRVKPSEVLGHRGGAERRPRCGSSEVRNNVTNNTNFIKAGTLSSLLT